MKIRTGFVSNSSSSSFILIATTNNHNLAMEKLDSFEKSIINALVGNRKVFGKDMVIGWEYNNQGYSNWEYLEPKFESAEDKERFKDGDEKYEVWSKYKKELRKLPEELFTDGIDM